MNGFVTDDLLEGRLDVWAKVGFCHDFDRGTLKSASGGVKSF